MQQEQDDKNSAIVKEKMSKEIIILLYWEKYNIL